MLSSTRTALAEAFWFQEGPGVRNTQFRDSGVKLLNVSNITKSGRIDLDKTDRHLDESEAFGKYKHFLADAGDLVIASSGISVDIDGLLRTRGAFISQHHLPLCMNTSTIRFKALREKSSLEFLKHWLQSSDFRSQITRLVTGSAQKNFGPSHLKQLWINLPPLPEQRRIAAILDQADALRAKRREALAKLRGLTQAIFFDMFGDPIQNPKQLRREKLANLIKLKSGEFLPATEMAEGGIYPVLGGNGINGYHSSYLFKEMQIVIGRVGAYCGCVHVSPPKSWITDNAMYVASRSSDLQFEYLRRALEIANLNSVASKFGQPLISGSRVYPVEILVPAIQEQEEFARRVYVVEEMLVKLNNSETELGSLFSSLQHRAFRGEL